MTAKKYSEGDIVEVRCKDIIQVGEWTKLELAALIPLPDTKFVGYFLNEDDICIRILTGIVKDYCEKTDVGAIVVPKGIIDSIGLIQESEIDDFEESEVDE